MQTLVADFGSQNTVDFVALGKSGCVGVIHRATRSNGQTDPKYKARRELALGVGLKWGRYAFNTGEVIKAQTDRLVNFVDRADDESSWLDLEKNPNGGQMTLGMTIEFLDRIDQWYGRRCGLYSGNVIKSLIPGLDPLSGRKISAPATDTQREFLALHPFWLCEYGPVARMVDANGHPLPWAKYFIYQFTGDGVGPEPHTLDGLEDGADLSLFDGTPDELRAAWPLPAIPAPAVA